MSMTSCTECGNSLSDQAQICPHCGCPVPGNAPAEIRRYRGFEWRTQAEILGYPLVHIAFGRHPETGKWMIAKGIIAIGQFALGLITIAQFGVGFLFGFGQCVAGYIAVGQAAFGIYFGLGQLATGYTAIGQMALGNMVAAQLGFGKYLLTPEIKDPEAVAYFTPMWEKVSQYLSY
jgi:hypothetical protein